MSRNIELLPTATKGRHKELQYEDYLDYAHATNEARKPLDRFGTLPRFQYVPKHKGNDGGSVSPHLLPFRDQGGEIATPNLELMPVAHKHLCNRLNVQDGLFDRLPFRLAHDVMNTLIQNNGYEKELMIRTVEDNKVRALMSKSYTPFDDIVLLDTLKPLMAGALVRWFDSSDTVSHIRITWPGTARELKKGDIVETGLHISNSEVGFRSVTVQGVVVRLACTNGMLSTQLKGGNGFRHVGNIESMKQKVLQIAEEAKFSTESLAAKFKASLAVRVDSPIDTMELYARDGGLTQEQFKRSLERFTMESEEGGALFDMVNAFTREAQEEPTAEGRYLFETAGAKMLQELA